MTILQIGILALLAVLIGRIRRAREHVLLAVSVFAMYWLQPHQPFVSLVFWLPTSMLGLTVLAWLFVTPAEMRTWRLNATATITMLAVMLLLDLNQFVQLEKIYITATPRLWMIGLAMAAYLILVCSLPVFWKGREFPLAAMMVGIIMLLVYVKSPHLLKITLDSIYTLRDQEPATRSYIFSWLGFSYVAFRLLHTIRDHQVGRLPSLSLGEYVNYVIFFPSFTAGPIERAERFIQDLRSPLALLDQDWIEAGKRFFLGLFKKFVVADALYFISINDVLVDQVSSPAWLWFFLYMYSLRIYFDFSGYTDMAIGLARVMGIRLPENFAAPYFKPNLAQFWNSWHMSLTEWFRAYFFNPLTRALRVRDVPVAAVILITQISTMILIGLWHGITWNFFLWGLWHGAGLYIQNRWSDFIRDYAGNIPPGNSQKLMATIGIFITFNFVSLGWLFFTLSTPAMAWMAFTKLLGGEL